MIQIQPVIVVLIFHGETYRPNSVDLYK